MDHHISNSLLEDCPRDSLLELFCEIDTFCLEYPSLQARQTLTEGKKTRNRARSLCLSEVMTLRVSFHRTGLIAYCHHTNQPSIVNNALCVLQP